ncbi:MAG TPA: metal-binding protein, partial [Lachnospiraceae bacterium]|nr:metal-binding protein [Lachnospiraceae bacterium]
MEILEKLEKIIEGCGAFECGRIAPEKVSFMPEVRSMCEVNSCGTYGTRWI